MQIIRHSKLNEICKKKEHLTFPIRKFGAALEIVNILFSSNKYLEIKLRNSLI